LIYKRKKGEKERMHKGRKSFAFPPFVHGKISYMKKTSPVQGFTIIELLVTIAIIGLLTSVVLVSTIQARENAKVKAETAAVELFELHFKLYREQTGGYPPSTIDAMVDNCSACGYGATSAGTINSWRTVADSMTPLITPSPIYEDVWGNPYAYDNNYRVSAEVYYTILCSVGPDEVLQTYLPSNQTNYLWTSNPNPQAEGDDICFFTR
jgi:prepilin-type N-terminal cleavage/methylation domain-containing protein